MKRFSRISFLFLVLLALGCEEEIITGISSKIFIEPVERSSATASIDKDTITVNMGEVALYSGDSALFRVTNPSTKTLYISEVKNKDDDKDSPFVVRSYPKSVLTDLASTQESYIVIHYAPLKEWQDKNGNGKVDDDELDKATFVVHSDASNGAAEIHVTGYGVFKGYPDLKVCYDNYCGPDDNAECQSEPGVGITCTTSVPLDFGNIGLNSTGTQTITLKNVADCPRPEGGDICDFPELCMVTVNQNSSRQNVGFGFEQGSNLLGHFQIVGSVAMPAELAQGVYTANCAEKATHLSEVKMRLNYNAPPMKSQDEAVLVIESNDPLNPLIRVPIKASAKVAPEAICHFRKADPNDPTAPYTTGNGIAPLTRVYFDGIDSRDNTAEEGAVNNGITSYEWEVIHYPDGTNPSDFQSVSNGRYFDFWLPLAGDYEVKLRVYDREGTASGDTQNSVCRFKVVPASKLHVQLVWDHPTNDQDLHLVYLDKSHVLCDKDADCFWQNKAPVWFSGDGASEGANPRLDWDDTSGMGPENVNIDKPRPGTYRVYVHYFAVSGAPSAGVASAADAAPASTLETRNTVRIHINSLQVAEYRRTLSNVKDMWAVADIIWKENDTAEVRPLEGSGGSDYGWICPDYTCSALTTCEAP